MLGEVDKAQCWLGKALNSPPNKAEDCAIVLLRYKSGAIITVDVSSVTVHPLTNRMELHGTKGTILEDHAWDNPVSILSSHEKAQVKGEFYSPKVEHGAYPEYYLISAREEDTHFAECILRDQPPEFTPEQAKQAIAVTLLSYLSAKKGAPASMSELATIAKTKGTKTILDGLDKAIQRNYYAMNWT
jgi:predicted dehydrogenase